MENWHKYFLLILVAIKASSVAANAEDTPYIIDPNIERREIHSPSIDTENFEIGIQYGMISIEDFDSAETYVLRLALHVTEDFFFEASYSEAQGDETSFEQISGGLPLFSSSDREFSHYDLALGWNIFPSQVFLGDGYGLNASFYLIAGIGNTTFLDDNWFTTTIGAGYRLLMTDSIAWHIDVRDHIFDREIFNIKETTNNIEFTTGISLFF